MEISEYWASERIQKIRNHYYDLIFFELQNLSEEKLLKTLIFLKDSSSETTKPIPVRAAKPIVPTDVSAGNFLLFDPKKKIEDPELKVSDLIEKDSKILKQYIANQGFVRGYGIIEIDGIDPSAEFFSGSRYICFCEPGAFDGMIQIRHRKGFVVCGAAACNYIITIKEVGKFEKEGNIVCYDIRYVKEELDKLVKKYKK